MNAQGTVRIGDTFPNLEGKSQYGDFKLYDYLGNSWGLFVSHPKDFTPVCTTELGYLAKITSELEKRNVKTVGLSVDSSDEHKKWILDINETQNTEVKYPIIADPDRKISASLGMLDQTNLDAPGLPLTVRSVFIIDPNKKVRLIITYPASCGRNFDEVLRCIDSLQLTDGKKLTTPANWKKGDDVIVAPNLPTNEAEQLFGKVNVVKPYLRYIKAEQIK
jgi:alkyl hydroperoxide reductase subunit AhpC